MSPEPESADYTVLDALSHQSLTVVIAVAVGALSAYREETPQRALDYLLGSAREAGA